MIELPDGSGCFTATILSNDEAMALPLKQRPLNHRISCEIYHAVFEAVGHASMCWRPNTGSAVFDSHEAEKCAVDLCFKIANEVEKWRESSATEVCAGNPAIAEYVASLENRLELSRKAYLDVADALLAESSGPEDLIKEAKRLREAAEVLDCAFVPVFEDGELQKDYTLAEVRNTLAS